MKKTTIQIDIEVKKFLDEKKIIERETCNSVIRRILNLDTKKFIKDEEDNNS